MDNAGKEDKTPTSMDLCTVEQAHSSHGSQYIKEVNSKQHLNPVLPTSPTGEELASVETKHSPQEICGASEFMLDKTFVKNEAEWNVEPSSVGPYLLYNSDEDKSQLSVEDNKAELQNFTDNTEDFSGEVKSEMISWSVDGIKQEKKFSDGLQQIGQQVGSLEDQPSRYPYVVSQTNTSEGIDRGSADLQKEQTIGFAHLPLWNENLHLLTNEKGKNHMCVICGMTFRYACYLKTHMRTHTGEKPYVCSHCGLAFKAASNLTEHRRTHTGEKPFTCVVCGETFATSVGLKIHSRTHTGEKPYSCDTCEAAFTNTSGLKRHKRTHTGEKPYSCDTCGSAFARSFQLKRHQRIHTGEKPFICSICRVPFAWEASLKRHLERHQGDKP